jgi:hypothetical protein
MPMVSFLLTSSDNDQEDTTFTFNLSTEFGPINGTVNAEGTSTLVPEPSPIVLALPGLMSIFGLGAFKIKSAHRR